MSGPRAGTGHWACAAIGALAAGTLYAGWSQLWFLTDDAYIAFRYASNARLGHGLVWNPPPFAPVEGYTSWLWVMLLRGAWSATGVPPPVSANWLSLACGYGTLLVCARLVWELELPPRLRPHRPWLLAGVLLGTVTNRSFLTWLSSGLETALFNFWIALWAYLAVSRAPPPGLRRPALCAAAAAATLTRPDGFVAVLGSAFLVATARGAPGEPSPSPGRRALELLPLGAVPLHLLWRWQTYGAWLPNTWHAKHLAPWPESGLRYAAAFALEYALWLWLAAVCLGLLRRPVLSRGAAVVTASLLAHFAYYALRIGGDHFEYRVYSHLVPLFFASFVALAARALVSPAGVLAALALFVVASWPIPWLLHLETRGLASRAETLGLQRPVAARLPGPLAAYGRVFDGLQGWLIERGVGIRRREHAVFHEFQRRTLPGRALGLRIRGTGPEDLPVLVAGTVGVLGWVLPQVAILDRHGLNDFVIARVRVKPRRRAMAHDRRPPPGYLECFEPNARLQWLAGGFSRAAALDVSALGGPQAPRRALRVSVHTRPPGRIGACERKWWWRVSGAGGASPRLLP